MKNEISIKAAIYLRAAELVEMGHCKGSLAQDAHGHSVCHDSKDAVRWCAYGAIRRAASELEHDVPDHYTWTQKRCGGLLSMWNNAPHRTQADVVTLLREVAFI